MKRTLSTILLLTILILALASCANKERPTITGEDASPDAIPDLVGSYSLNGFDPTGDEYGGVLIIKDGTKPGEYAMQWLITGSIQEGTGVLAGNQLQAEWHSIKGMETETHGVVTYTITTKGELYGTRTATGYEGEGTENAFPNDERWGKFHLGPQLK